METGRDEDLPKEVGREADGREASQALQLVLLRWSWLRTFIHENTGGVDHGRGSLTASWMSMSQNRVKLFISRKGQLVMCLCMNVPL